MNDFKTKLQLFLSSGYVDNTLAADDSTSKWHILNSIITSLFLKT